MNYSNQSVYEHQMTMYEKLQTLETVSGYDIDSLIDLFKKGFTLKGPRSPVSLESLGTPRSKKIPPQNTIKAKRGY